MDTEIAGPLTKIGLSRDEVQPFLDRHMGGLSLREQQAALADVAALMGLASMNGAPMTDAKFAMALRILADVLDLARPTMQALDQLQKLDPGKAGN